MVRLAVSSAMRNTRPAKSFVFSPANRPTDGRSGGERAQKDRRAPSSAALPPPAPIRATQTQLGPRRRPQPAPGGIREPSGYSIGSIGEKFVTFDSSENSRALFWPAATIIAREGPHCACALRNPAPDRPQLGAGSANLGQCKQVAVSRPSDLLGRPA